VTPRPSNERRKLCGREGKKKKNQTGDTTTSARPSLFSSQNDLCRFPCCVIERGAEGGKETMRGKKKEGKMVTSWALAGNQFCPSE